MGEKKKMDAATPIELRPPLQALLLAPDAEMWRAVGSGSKELTIREGWRDYKPGRVMICCHIASVAVMAEIVSVTRALLQDVCIDDVKADGCDSHEELLQALRRYYPDITLQSPVTVIRWSHAQGSWVDHCRNPATTLDGGG